MNKLKKKLEEIKKRKRIGLMTHVVIGYPTLQETVNFVKIMANCGVDMVELQIPFSDPLADGPTIMQACEKSLENGTKVKDAFAIMKQLTNQVSIPLLFMAYYNTVFKYGTERFCKDAKEAGASGLIVPDMSIDEEKEEHYFALCKKYNLSTIQVVSPASTEKRLVKNKRVANGFIYCTARQGITGAKNQLNSDISAYLKNVRKVFSIPVAVGFGISNKNQIKILDGSADIAVVGSAIIDRINTFGITDTEKTLREFIESLQSK